MKYTPSIAFDEFAGSAKGVTAAKTRGRKYIRNKGYGNPSNTVSQSGVKAIFRQLTKSFKALTPAQIVAWNTVAQSQEGRSTLGTKAKISGLNLYLRLNYWVVVCGGTVLNTPPDLTGVEAPSEATISLSSSVFTLTLDSIPDDVTNLKLVIKASMPVSNGISDAFAKATIIGDPQEPVDTAIDLKTTYVAKYEEPSASRPKIFLSWFYVNTSTGEKSGEMLGMAILSE